MVNAADEVAEKVAAAAATKTPLILRANGGRMFYGNPADGEVLDLSSLIGEMEYEPSELFVAVPAATELAEIELLLQKNGQMLAFEPPHFSATATAGGALACGLSGPRRPSSGALRDHILGVSVVCGRGRQMTFGGRVIKNVAGFDVSRLMAGALGVLGAATEVVFRTAAIPECEITTIAECDAADAIAADNIFLGKGLPLTGGVWCGGKCWRRFSGGEESLRRAVREAGGDILSAAEHRAFWRAVREHEHEFFSGGGDLWRIVAPPQSPLLAGDDFVEWHGAVRWRRGDEKSAMAAAKLAGGAATLFRADDAKRGRFPPPPPALQKIYRELKRVFDPENILNRGRLYDFGD